MPLSKRRLVIEGDHAVFWCEVNHCCLHQTLEGSLSVRVQRELSEADEARLALENLSSLCPFLLHSPANSWQGTTMILSHHSKFRLLAFCDQCGIAIYRRFFLLV